MELTLASRRPRWWLALAVAGLALAALVFAARPGTAGAQDQAISIANFAFSPSSIQITAGSTITWTNNDAVAHTVTADDGSFDSGLIQPGDSFSHTFDSAGTVAYHCSVHPNMTAEVVVMDAAQATAPPVEETAPAEQATAPAPEQQATAASEASSNGNAAPAASTAASSASTTLPNTGSGTGSGGHLGLFLLAIGVIGILGGTGVVARRHKNID